MGYLLRQACACSGVLREMFRLVLRWHLMPLQQMCLCVRAHAVAMVPGARACVHDVEREESELVG